MRSKKESHEQSKKVQIQSIKCDGGDCVDFHKLHIG